ncbi:MAG: transposase [Candidatus Aureabacteria bacterium]|nr:transposase [Candidatus Auribacterota bacterium]
MPARTRRNKLKGSLVFHASNRSCNDMVIFHGEDDCRHFVNLLSAYCERFCIAIYHWVIMPSHFRIAFEIADPRETSCFMAGLNRAYTHYHHNHHGSTGYLWQGRFALQPIQKENYLLSCGRYIERNPVRANLVQEAHEYHYSSAKFYCFGIRDIITRENPMFEKFGIDIGKRNENYRKFLCYSNPEEEKLFGNSATPLGDVYFTKRLWCINGRYMPQGRGRAPGTNNRIISSRGVC